MGRYDPPPAPEGAWPVEVGALRLKRRLVAAKRADREARLAARRFVRFEMPGLAQPFTPAGKGGVPTLSVRCAPRPSSAEGG